MVFGFLLSIFKFFRKIVSFSKFILNQIGLDPNAYWEHSGPLGLDTLDFMFMVLVLVKNVSFLEKPAYEIVNLRKTRYDKLIVNFTKFTVIIQFMMIA